MKKIVIIEGADGTGKSTLAAALASEIKGNVIHATFSKKWDMEDYHTTLIEAASELSDYQPVILDRWAISEAVYGPIFRRGEAYETWSLIKDWSKYVVFVYCRNTHVEANHQEHRKDRYEMFETMEEVQKGYDKWFEEHAYEIPHLVYDFNYNNKDEFVKKIIKEMKRDER